ncbi:hypothetical protein I6E24_15380 [Bacteroides caecigallinarum]|nr:hypothetical protein [Bacteroides caecigallinarum]
MDILNWRMDAMPWIAGLTVVSLPVIKMGLWQNRRPIPSYAICREQTW